MPESDEKCPEKQAAATGDGTFSKPTTDPSLPSGINDEQARPLVAEAVREVPESLAYRIFVGPQGLRAGWSIFFFWAVLILLYLPVQLVVDFLSPRPSISLLRPSNLIAPEAGFLLAVTLATLIMARIEGRAVLSYGFSGQHKLMHFLAGLCSGVAALSALIAVLKAANVLAFDGQTLHGLLAWKYALEWAIGYFLVALFEESLLRGYVQSTLARGIGFWWSALVLSAGFGLLHLGNHGESPVGIFSAMAIGMVFCLSLWLTNSLWWAVGMHAGWDWAQSYLYGVADSGMTVAGHLYGSHPVGALLWSGGPTGPEGSLYVIPVTLIVGAGVWLTLKPKQRQAARRLPDAA